MDVRSKATAAIIEKAMRDEAFRQELLRDPRTAIEAGLGITIPPQLTITVVEDTPDTVHLVLPPSGMPAATELTDPELEEVAGGWNPWSNNSECGSACEWCPGT